VLARILLFLVLPIGLAALSGCGPDRLDFSKTVAYDPGSEPPAFDLDPQSKPQTFTVKYESTTEPVTVAVYKAEDAQDVYRVKPTTALGYESGKTSGTFTVPIPAKTAVRVVLSGPSKKTEIKLQLSNR